MLSGLPEILKPREVAQILKVSERTVYAWIDCGYLPACRINTTIRILKKDLIDFLETNKTIDKPIPLRRLSNSKLSKLKYTLETLQSP